jgi:RNA-binding protein FUS
VGRGAGPGAGLTRVPACVQIARIRQKRGYKDQWPFNIKIYTDDSGKQKGDGVLTYEDPAAAHSAGGFFNGN